MNNFKKNFLPADSQSRHIQVIQCNPSSWLYSQLWCIIFSIHRQRNVSFSLATAEGAAGVVVFECCDIFSTKRLQQTVSDSGQICNLQHSKQREADPADALDHYQGYEEIWMLGSDSVFHLVFTANLLPHRMKNSPTSTCVIPVLPELTAYLYIVQHNLYWQMSLVHFNSSDVSTYSVIIRLIY
jgi:hypothetical protein